MIDQLFTLLRKEFLYKNNEKRIEEQEWLFNYYVGNKFEILNYLDNVLSLTFDENDIVEFQKDYINITRKIVNALSVIYREPAIRYFAEEYSQNKNRTRGEWTEYYNNILPPNINTIDKTINRYGNLFNTAITEIQLDKNTGKIRYINRASHLYDVIVDENNIYKPTRISYQRMMTLKGKPEQVTIVWTDKNHYGVTGLGNDFPIGDNSKMENPYGVLPFAIWMMEEQDDFWGNGQSDLVNGNEQINFLLTDLINGGIIMQAWGTPVAINLGLAKKNKDNAVVTQRPRVGPKHPIVQENVRKDMTQPSLEYKNANPLIREVMDVIDWKINKLAAIKGLNPNTISAKVMDTSGFSKVVDAVEQMELRKDSIEPSRTYEMQRFEITKTINNVYALTKVGKQLKLKTIPDLTFTTDFAEIKMPVTVGDQVISDNHKLGNNVISVLDVARRDNPDLTDEQILEMLKKNKEYNNEFYSPSQANTNNINMSDTSKAKAIKTPTSLTQQ